jgi:hypothetical protein
MAYTVNPKLNDALLIAATIVASIRLRGERIERTPRVLHQMSFG